MRPEHVIVVNDFGFVNGGASQIAIATVRLLSGAGLGVDYFCAVAPVDEGLLSSAANVVCLEQPDILNNPNRLSAAIDGLWNLRAARMFRDLLSERDPRSCVVHVHSWTKALSSSIFPEARRLGFSTVLTLHDFFTACPNGGFFDYQQQAICHRRPMGFSCLTTHCDSRNYTQKLWRVGRQALQSSLAGVPHALGDFIAVSEFSANILKPFLPESARIHLVPNPVDGLPSRRVEVKGNSQYFFVGRLSQEKGCTLFAQGVQATGVSATVVGEGPQRENMVAIASDLRMKGWLNRSQLYAELGQARCLVFPSLWYETQGLVVAEAASLGVPSIVADMTAAADSVVDGQTGLLFRSGSLDDLTEKIRITFDDGVVEELGSEAYDNFWKAPPDEQRYLSRLLLVYEDILSASHSQQGAM